MSNGENERAQPKTGGDGDKPSKPDAPKQGAAEADDVTMGEEAQKHRDEMMRQEKAEGDRR